MGNTRVSKLHISAVVADAVNYNLTVQINDTWIVEPYSIHGFGNELADNKPGCGLDTLSFIRKPVLVSIAGDAPRTVAAHFAHASVRVIEKKPEISYEDFDKLQFRVGKIIKCEEVPKSKKLLCSQVKIGSQVKQIVSGIKQHYSAEEMVGKKVMVLVNLKPAKLAGVLSEGMLLCAEDADGNLALMTPEKKMPAGAEIC